MLPKTSEWLWKHAWLIQYGKALVHTTLSAQQFLAAKNMAVVHNPTYLPEWACEISSCFQKLNNSYKNIISRMSLKFRNNCQLTYKQFKKISLRSAYTSGRNIRPAAYSDH